MGIYREFDAHKQPLKYKRCFCDLFSCRFLPLASFDVPVSHLQRSAGDNKIAKIHLYRWKEPLKSGKLPSIKVMTFSCIL